MRTQRISVRIDKELQRRLEWEVETTGKREAEVVREALEEHLKKQVAGENAYTVALRCGIIGSIRGAPADLSKKKQEIFSRIRRIMTVRVIADTGPLVAILSKTEHKKSPLQGFLGLGIVQK